MGGDEHLRLACKEHVCRLESARGASQLFLLGVRRSQAEEDGWAGLAQVRVRVGQVHALGAGHRDERQSRLFGQMPVGVGGPRRHESDLEALQPRPVFGVQQRMRPGFRWKQAMRESGGEGDLELETLGLMHGHHLHGVPASGCRLGVVRGAREQRIQRPAEVGQQRFRSVQPFVHLLHRLQAVDGRTQVVHRLGALFGT